MQKGRTVTLHIVSSLDGFIAKKDNGSPGWRVLEASTKPVLEQRSFTKRKLKFCDTLSKHLSFDKRAGYVNFHHSLSSEMPLIRRRQRSLVNTTALGRTNRR